MSDLNIRNLRLQLAGKTVLDDISLSCEAGAFIVLAGPSGSGKSSLLRAIAGLLPIQAGSIHADAVSLDSLPPGQRDIALVFQDHALMPHLTVAQNLAFGLRARGLAKKQALARAQQVAERLGLAHVLTRKPAQISGGEQQRVALGRAMLREARLVLMDEPLSSLDAPLRARLRQEILALHRKLGWTTIYVTHDQTEALAMADHLGVLIDGRLQQFAPPQQVYRQPASLAVARFIGSGQINLLPVRQQAGGLSYDWSQAEAPALWLGLRPESLQLAATGDASGLPAFEARLQSLEYWGDRQLARFRRDALNLQVLLAAETRLEPGRDYPLQPQMSEGVLFDPASGAALPQ